MKSALEEADGAVIQAPRKERAALSSYHVPLYCVDSLSGRVDIMVDH